MTWRAVNRFSYYVKWAAGEGDDRHHHCEGVLGHRHGEGVHGRVEVEQPRFKTRRNMKKKNNCRNILFKVFFSTILFSKIGLSYGCEIFNGVLSFSKTLNPRHMKYTFLNLFNI